METPIRIPLPSGWLAGVMHIPESYRPGQYYPAVVLSHGMANNRDEAGQHDFLARSLEAAGYVVLRFDFRGCGESGERGRMMIGSEWPQDLQAAISFLQARPEVIPDRIAAVGSSWGGGVTLYTTAIDRRIRCAVSLGAPADGRRWLRHQWFQIFGEEGWQNFLSSVEEDRARFSNGQPSKIVRLIGGFIPVPPEQIPFYDTFLAENPGIIADVPLNIAEDILSFAPEKLVHRISPTPLLIIHGKADPVVDYQEALKVYERAGDPKELLLIDEGIHQLLLGETGEKTALAILQWLNRYL